MHGPRFEDTGRPVSSPTRGRGTRISDDPERVGRRFGEGQGLSATRKAPVGRSARFASVFFHLAGETPHGTRGSTRGVLSEPRTVLLTNDRSRSSEHLDGLNGRDRRSFGGSSPTSGSGPRRSVQAPLRPTTRSSAAVPGSRPSPRVNPTAAVPTTALRAAGTTRRPFGGPLTTRPPWRTIPTGRPARIPPRLTAARRGDLSG
jgi:hypothetical protein